MTIRKTFTTFFLVLYSTTAFNFIIPVLGYYVFYDYIISELCIQKDAEENLCMGKCHLKKQIQNESTTDKKPEQKNSLVEMETYSPHFLDYNDLIKNYQKPSRVYKRFLYNLRSCSAEPVTPPPQLFVL